jgi:hypothetical protein
MTPLEELIEIYATVPADKVRQNARFVTLRQLNDADEIFHSHHLLVEGQRRLLENTVAAQKTWQKEVKFALKAFQQLLNPQDKDDLRPEIFLRLVRRAYYPGWTAKQQSYFDAIIDHIRNKQDYFLSFTQRKVGDGSNPINSLQRYLIQTYGIPDPKDEKENKLALMLHRALASHQFRGFFYPEYTGDTLQVAQKLKEGMDQSLVFIQLVQNEMFSKQYPAQPNYCADEYLDAAHQKKQMIYLFANGAYPADLILDYNVNFDFNPWYQFIHGAQCLDLAPTLTADQSTNITGNRQKIREQLIDKMTKFREALWENVPGDLD